MVNVFTDNDCTTVHVSTDNDCTSRAMLKTTLLALMMIADASFTSMAVQMKNNSIALLLA